MNPTTQLDFHPDAESLNAFAEQALADREREQILTHLAACSRCRQVVYLSQEAAAGTETAPPAQVLTSESASRPFSWFTNWRLAWVPVTALAAVVGIAVFVHIRRAETGMELAKVAPRPILQNGENDSKPAERERASTATVQPLASPVSPPIANHAESNTRSKPIPPPAFASPALPAMAGAIDGPHFARNESLAPPGASEQGFDGQVVGAQFKPETAVEAWQQQQAVGAISSHASAAKSAPAGLNAEVDNMQVRRSSSATPSAPQLALTATPPRNFEAADRQQSAKLFAVRMPKISRLPSGLTAVSTATGRGSTLAIDQAGKLFVSRDQGNHWEIVANQWTGRAVEVRINKTLNDDAHDAAPSSSETVPESNSKTATAPRSANATFEIVNDNGLVWVSTDGRTWKAK